MKKIFTKADEMELAINYKAARNAYAFLVLTLAIYCLICFLKTGELPWVWLIFIGSGLVFWGTKLIRRLIPLESAFVICGFGISKSK